MKDLINHIFVVEQSSGCLYFFYIFELFLYFSTRLMAFYRLQFAILIMHLQRHFFSLMLSFREIINYIVHAEIKKIKIRNTDIIGIALLWMTFLFIVILFCAIIFFCPQTPPSIAITRLSHVPLNVYDGRRSLQNCRIKILYSCFSMPNSHHPVIASQIFVTNNVLSWCM